MSLFFVWDWLQQLWTDVRTFDYSIFVQYILNVFNFVHNTFEELTKSGETIPIIDDITYYEKHSKKEYSIYVVTWNIGNKLPPCPTRVFNLLKIDEDYKTDKESHPDLYVIGLQEVGAVLHKISSGVGVDGQWVQIFLDVLCVRNYILVKCKQMQGLMLLLFVKRQYMLQLRKIEAEHTRTGLGGLLGNKGAVSIRLSLAGCALCLVNCHFAADDDSMQDRVEDFQQVVNNHNFKLSTHRGIFEHDVIIWFGDLNFRLAWNNKMDPEEVWKLIESNERDKLWNIEELHYLMENGKVFYGFIEQTPHFPPTYKFEHGSPFYNLKKKPAWTDRILYKTRPDFYSNVAFKINQGIYNSYAECDISDHRPVATEYNLKVIESALQKYASIALILKCLLIQNFTACSQNYWQFIDESQQSNIKGNMTEHLEQNVDSIQNSVEFDPSRREFVDHSRYIVEFNKIPYWLLDEVNIIEYTLPAGFCENPGYDWIALYRSDFDDLSKYVSYQYVTGYSTVGPSPAHMSSPPSTEPYKECSDTVRKRRILLDFSENGVNITERGKYVLLYFEREKGGVMGVAGISNNFVAISADDNIDKKQM